MNCVTELHVRRTLAAIAIGSAVALAAGCSTLDGDGGDTVKLAPTVEIAVAPLDLPNDYYGAETVFVPVAPWDLPDDYFTRAAAGSDGEEIAVASSDDWLIP